MNAYRYFNPVDGWTSDLVGHFRRRRPHEAVIPPTLITVCTGVNHLECWSLARCADQSFAGQRFKTVWRCSRRTVASLARCWSPCLVRFVAALQVDVVAWRPLTSLQPASMQSNSYSSKRYYYHYIRDLEFLRDYIRLYHYIRDRISIYVWPHRARQYLCRRHRSSRVAM